MPHATKDQPRSVWSALAHRPFRAIWIASVASHIGSYMTDVGQGWLMASLTPSPLIISLLVTAESLPFFALGVPAGALADIVDRRRLLIISQFAMAVAVGGEHFKPGAKRSRGVGKRVG